MLMISSNRRRELTLPVSTGWLLADCMEARGKQDLWMRQKPEVVKALRELRLSTRRVHLISHVRGAISWAITLFRRSLNAVDELFALRAGSLLSPTQPAPDDQ